VKTGRGKRALLRAIVASLTATALLAIGILLFGHFGQTEGRILMTTMPLAGYGLLALPAGFLFDQERLAGLAWTVLALASAGFAVLAALIWSGDDPPEGAGEDGRDDRRLRRRDDPDRGAGGPPTRTGSRIRAAPVPCARRQREHEHERRRGTTSSSPDARSPAWLAPTGSSTGSLRPRRRAPPSAATPFADRR
jgi:hypothetical protein